MSKKKVIVGMSGGIDSTATLYILKKHGYEVEGVTLKYWHWEDSKNTILQNQCCNVSTIDKAKYVCDILKVKHNVIDVSDMFRKYIVEKSFIDEYVSGGVPNPCIYCNNLLKFGYLIDYLKDMDSDFVSTGHYADVLYNGRYSLVKGIDKIKDQTYFLYLLDQYKLSKILFPLGKFYKKDVINFVKNEVLDFYDEVKESQNLCFVSNDSLDIFLSDRVGVKKGDIILYETLDVVGSHDGYYHFTIGQRKKLTNLKVPTNSGPYFVCKIDHKKNIVYVSNNKEHLNIKDIILDDIHLIDNDFDFTNKILQVKNRSTSDFFNVGLYKVDNKTKVEFLEPIMSITKGQHLVFYDGDVVVGGAKIT